MKINNRLIRFLLAGVARVLRFMLNLAARRGAPLEIVTGYRQAIGKVEAGQKLQPGELDSLKAQLDSMESRERRS